MARRSGRNQVPRMVVHWTFHEWTLRGCGLRTRSNCEASPSWAREPCFTSPCREESEGRKYFRLPDPAAGKKFRLIFSTYF